MQNYINQAFKKNILIFLSVFIISGLSSDTGKTIVYLSDSSKEPVSRTLKLSGSGSELLAEQLLSFSEEKIFMSAEHHVYKWEFKKPGKKIDVEGRREGNEIFIKGIKKGKSYDKTFEIDDHPWFQAWEIGLDSFILDPSPEVKFWSVSPDMPKPGLFTAVKMGEEKIEISGKTWTAQKVFISMKGFSPKIFSSIFWFEPETGLLLKSEYKMFGSRSGESLQEVK